MSHKVGLSKSQDSHFSGLENVFNLTVSKIFIWQWKNQAQRHNMCILNHDKNSLVLGKESIYLPIPKSFY